jgi:prepilin-type N-terminal cleavage/methylation domain-containing protein
MNRGFTLVEVAVAVLILGIVGMVTVPAFQGLLRHDGEVAAADEVVRVLRGARLAATERGAVVEVVVDPQGGRYWAWLHARPGEVALLRDSAFRLPPGTRLEGAGPRVRFLFRPAGAPMGGTVVVRSGEGVRVVGIDRWTGDPHVQAR